MRTISFGESVMLTESPSILNLLNASRPLEMTVQGGQRVPIGGVGVVE